MRESRVFLIVMIICLSVTGSIAGAAKSWDLEGEEKFSGGTLDGVSVMSTGELTLGPEVSAVSGLDANYVWDIAAGHEDGTFYVATGSPAAVYKYSEGELELLHRMSEEHVQSVLPLTDGRVLAGTAPRGVIYEIDPEGEVTVFRDLNDQYIWDMVSGDDEESIYCATGPAGRLLHIEGDQEAREIYRLDRGNLMCLEFDSERNRIYGGSEPSGTVFEFTPEGEVAVIFEADESEVHSLMLGDEGVVYAVTAQADGEGMRPARAPARGEEGNGGNGEGKRQEKSQAPAGGRNGGEFSENTLYAITPGQGGNRLAGLGRAIGLSMSLRDDGEVFVGTGGEGRVVGVSPDGVTRLVTGFRAAHVSAMSRAPNGTVLIGTSDGGGLWVMSPGFTPEATYTSKVFDAGFISNWHRVETEMHLPDDADVRTEIRTGNRKKPDRTWSDWVPAGDSLDVRSGRFAQLRAVLRTEEETATPEVRRIVAYYREVNRRPEIDRLSLGERGNGGDRQQGNGRGQENPSRSPREARKQITWDAVDPNNDELSFDLFYRATDEKDWKPLDERMRGRTEYEWDTERVPDGRYMLRLVADDGPDRPPEDRLRAEKVAGPFLIDNGRPSVQELAIETNDDGERILTGEAVDEVSRIAQVQFSHNAGDWQPAFPGDGAFDSTQEDFEADVGELDEGEQVFVVIAIDTAGNIGSGRLKVDVESPEKPANADAAEPE
ncbi:MAG: hypothetical protein ACOCQ9_02145 [Candidatus Brocadiia bacterium]